MVRLNETCFSGDFGRTELFAPSENYGANKLRFDSGLDYTSWEFNFDGSNKFRLDSGLEFAVLELNIGSSSILTRGFVILVGSPP